MKMNKKGFTLIELLVVVLIIGILAAIALPQYFKAVERSRAAEALSLFAAIAGAEQRYYLVRGAYTTDFTELDLDFVNQVTVGSAAAGTNATGNTLTTNNFTVTLGANAVTATRTNGRYQNYTLSRNYDGAGGVTCSGADDLCPSLGL